LSKIAADNVEIALAPNNLGALYQALGRGVEAAASFRRALGIFEKALDDGHPYLTTCLENLSAPT
jgi:hypothetical protein